MKKILIIGGTYFLGKAFVELMLNEGDAELILLHRNGREEIKHNRIREVFADRHDTDKLAGLDLGEEIDAIVDFCAYAEGDIKNLLGNISARVKQYVFISTSDVYKRGTGKLLNEDADFEERDFGGDVGAYISGKVSLEREIMEACAEKNCRYTVLRPVFIFGENNYAPREGIYFQWILKAGQVLHPADADGEFQLVYVKDVAKAIAIVIGNEDACDRAFNVCENKMFTYDSFEKLLKSATGTDFERIDTDVATVNEKGIPLPFPLTKAESNYYDGSSLIELGMTFTQTEEAMKDTYEAFLSAQ